ncbi:MAG TPA: serine--tRNA ligase [Myxococcales bacterium]|nr:serine--tRNA ligase [Myxococcales bacterium]
MLDLKWVVANLPEARRRLATRNAAAAEALSPIEALSVERKQLILASETERAEQKKASEQMRVLKGDEQAALRARLKTLSDGVKEKDALLKGVEDQIGAVLMTVPNLPHETVPVGTEADNKVIREWGTKPEVPNAKEHVEVGEKLGMLDFERAAKVSGARFVFYKGALARLELAVVQFFLENARQRGYLELIPPYLVNADSMRGTGQLPKFEEDLFKTTSGYYLIPTAEVPVTNYHRDEILESLPLHYAAFSPCFRSEAGSAGKDTKGIIRQHQFHKVELVRFEKAENAQAALEQLVLDAQAPLQQLGLHHRVVLLSSGDTSFASEKTYDLEVWLPGQGAFREISSCSSFGEFQARRAQIRFRPAPGEKPRFAATLNGSGLAVGRTVVAILENGQQPDGSVVLPEAIRPYMGGMDRLVPR